MARDMNYKGLKAVAKESQKIVQRSRDTWVTVYYNVEDNSVNTKGKGWAVCQLIRPCDEKEIASAVYENLWM